MIASTFRLFMVLTGAVAAGVTLFWFWLAVGVHLNGWTLRVAQLAIGAAGFAALAFLAGLHWQRLFALVIAGILLGQLWWAFVPVPHEADWAPELAHGVSAVWNADGTVTLENVRNFDWTSVETFEPRWESRTVDPKRVVSVDVFTSVWGNPLIAHTMLSFGFEDGQHVVFSSEIRRQEGQVYSTLGGFVREFPLILIAADERDVIHLRTDQRREVVSLYPLTLTAGQREALFRGFVEFGNGLAAQPRWYNTLTENCTTVPFRIVRHLGDRIPLDWRILASGRLWEYLHDRGVLAPGMTGAEIQERARLPVFGPVPADGAAYSAAIRKGWGGQ